MTMIEALLLGIIQGLSEFIPISSTAHLTIAASLLGVIDPNHPERWTAFMAVVQLGTLGAVIMYFRREIRSMVMSFLRENLIHRTAFAQQSADARMGWLVLLGSVPIIVIGLLFKDAIEGAFTKDLRVIATSLIGLAVVLWFVDRRAAFQRTTATMSVRDALLIGLAQAVALVPGSSRSGTTITAALAAGFTRESAARFSFLLSIPAVAGAGVLEFLHELDHIQWAEGGMELAGATIAAALSGYWSIAFLLDFLRKRTMTSFVAYRVALGLLLFGLLALGAVSPLP
ncbi:MAG: undecaprenyl-diphosphatase UppP [Candidatus Kapabacteria bacterium]|nr:undecaprenyl-diphosphatase UppP [Candidatus Kapabacteria bacterium]